MNSSFKAGDKVLILITNPDDTWGLDSFHGTVQTLIPSTFSINARFTDSLGRDWNVPNMFMFPTTPLMEVLV